MFVYVMHVYMVCLHMCLVCGKQGKENTVPSCLLCLEHSRTDDIVWSLLKDFWERSLAVGGCVRTEQHGQDAEWPSRMDKCE